jgi:hypothetical protein
MVANIRPGRFTDDRSENRFLPTGQYWRLLNLGQCKFLHAVVKRANNGRLFDGFKIPAGNGGRLFRLQVNVGCGRS